MTTHLIIPDNHAHPGHHNHRATWLGELIADLKPDKVIAIGDSADMPSLASYDKGKRSFQGRTYRADVNSHLDFQDRMWSRVSARKKKMPTRYFFEGNHEERISRAINSQPELDGAVSFSDLRLGDWYDEVVRYEGGTPGIKDIDGVTYAHYFISGIAGKSLGGLHPADSLISKRHSSSTCGHSHLADWSTQIDGAGRRINACVVGCYVDYRADWAGAINDFWWSGVVVKRNVHQGNYDVQFVSIEAIKKAYGHLS